MTNLPAPVGRWWLAYDDGTVWPCEVIGPSAFPGHWSVRPVAPAPDAGTVRVVRRNSVFDSAANAPTLAGP